MCLSFFLFLSFLFRLLRQSRDQAGRSSPTGQAIKHLANSATGRLAALSYEVSPVGGLPGEFGVGGPELYFRVTAAGRSLHEATLAALSPYGTYLHHCHNCLRTLWLQVPLESDWLGRP